MNVIPISTPRRPLSAHASFCLHRQHMIAAFQTWLKENPMTKDVEMEHEGTVNALTQIAALWLMSAE